MHDFELHISSALRANIMTRDSKKEEPANMWCPALRISCQGIALPIRKYLNRLFSIGVRPSQCYCLSSWFYVVIISSFSLSSFLFVFWHMQLYICLDTSYYFSNLSVLLKYCSYFFKYSCTNIFHRRSLYTFYHTTYIFPMDPNPTPVTCARQAIVLKRLPKSVNHTNSC